LLTIDVGNTATSFGLFDVFPFRSRPHPLKVWTVSTSSLHPNHGSRHAREGGHPGLKHVFKKIVENLDSGFRRNDGLSNNVHGGIVSSVVPSVNKSLAGAVKNSFGRNPIFVTGRTHSKVKILTRNPLEVGADRLVNARAALEIFKGPSIVVDFGTAATFD